MRTCAACLPVGAHGELHDPQNSALSRAAEGVIKDDYSGPTTRACECIEKIVSGSSSLSRVADFPLKALFWQHSLPRMIRARLAGRLTAHFAVRCSDRAAAPTSCRWFAAVQDRAARRTCGGGASHGSLGSAAPCVSLWQGEAEWQLRGEEAPVLRAPAQNALHRLGLGARQMIVPRGFPGSVSPGYEGYTGWLAVGLFAHSFTVMVSTNALLSGFFAEMSAASWLLKDLLPPLLAGTLASRIRTLEANPKK